MSDGIFKRSLRIRGYEAYRDGRGGVERIWY